MRKRWWLVPVAVVALLLAALVVYMVVEPNREAAWDAYERHMQSLRSDGGHVPDAHL